MSQRRLWYVEKNGETKGPFLSAQITRNILLGRLQAEDKISLDEVNWQEIAKHRELYPDVMQQEQINQDELSLARIQADERIVEKRRQKKKMEQERRQTRERRGTEPKDMLDHRKNRSALNESYKNKIKQPKLPAFPIAILVIVMMIIGFILKPYNEKALIDCSSPASKGVNWGNCQFTKLDVENLDLESSILTDAKLNESNLLGVNLSGSDMAYAEVKNSDLSYANLEGVRLIGADLKQTDLRYANLQGADLSYADLNGALLAGANIKDTQFDNAIWTDGKICKKGSIGSCQ